VESVAFTGLSVGERAIEAAVYQAIAPQVDQLDQALRNLSKTILEECGGREEDEGEDPDGVAR
jgi:hypothetical protein